MNCYTRKAIAAASLGWKEDLIWDPVTSRPFYKIVANSNFKSNEEELGKGKTGLG